MKKFLKWRFLALIGRFSLFAVVSLILLTAAGCPVQLGGGIGDQAGAPPTSVAANPGFPIPGGSQPGLPTPGGLPGGPSTLPVGQPSAGGGPPTPGSLPQPLPGGPPSGGGAQPTAGAAPGNPLPSTGNPPPSGGNQPSSGGNQPSSGSGGSGGGGAVLPGKTITVKMVKDPSTASGFGFQTPNGTPNMTIHKGTKVIWMDITGIPHTVTAGADGDPAPSNPSKTDFGKSDSGLLTAKGTYSFTFNTATVGKTYSYHCTLHPGQVGTITIVA